MLPFECCYDYTIKKRVLCVCVCVCVYLLPAFGRLPRMKKIHPLHAGFFFQNHIKSFILHLRKR